MEATDEGKGHVTDLRLTAADFHEKHDDKSVQSEFRDVYLMFARSGCVHLFEFLKEDAEINVQSYC
jgi:hypothetical protein